VGFHNWVFHTAAGEKKKFSVEFMSRCSSWKFSFFI